MPAAREGRYAGGFTGGGWDLEWEVLCGTVWDGEG